MSQILTPAPCVRSFASVRQTARRVGPRLVQLVLYMVFSISYLSYRICSHRTLAYFLLFPGTPGKRRLREEPPQIERLLLAPHVIHRAAQLRLQDRQGFLLAALAGLAVEPFLRVGFRTQHQARSF